MTKERFEERKGDFIQAVKRLTEAVAQPENEFLRDAVIQRFEFCFELAWKALKIFLERQGVEAVSPRQVFKKAFQENLISNAEEGDLWLQMIEDRNLASHTYEEALAQEIYRRIARQYSPLFQKLAQNLKKLPWE